MIALEQKKTSTATQGTYELIKGEFSPAEASEIINEMFSKKINFHEVKSFSQLIRYGAKDEATLQRLNELKLNQQFAKDLIQEAKEAGKSLRVRSTISIEFI